MSSFGYAATLAAICSVPLTAGCAAPPPVHIAGVIGPEPLSEAAPDNGWLLVYTETRTTGFGEYEEENRQPYCVLDLRGRQVASVSNLGYRTDPTPLAIAPGEYFVRARGSFGAVVDVRVRVVARRTTSVFLDRSQPAVPGRAPAVVAPDGSFVGWRATMAD